MSIKNITYHLDFFFSHKLSKSWWDNVYLKDAMCLMMSHIPRSSNTNALCWQVGPDNMGMSLNNQLSHKLHVQGETSAEKYVLYVTM